MDRKTKTIGVIGANGRLGREVAKAFLAGGWSVRAITRRGDCRMSGVENIAADALDPASLAAAAHGCDFLFHGVNPVYTDWDNKVVPMLQATIAAASAQGATILFPGNVYNYGFAIPEHPDEHTPFASDHPKARLRIAMERMMQQAVADGVRSIVIRAGDFFGGDGPGSWFDQAVASKVRQGKVVWPGPGGVVHAWAYVPDLARAFVAAAETADTLPPYSAFQFGGHNLTLEEMQAAIGRATGRTMGRAAFPWWLLRLASPFNPMFREFVRMSYLWRRPHKLTGERLEQAVGPLSRTPVEEAVGQALRAMGALEKPAGSQSAMRTLAA